MQFSQLETIFLTDKKSVLYLNSITMITKISNKHACIEIFNNKKLVEI